MTAPGNPDHAGAVLAMMLVDSNGDPVTIGGGGSNTTFTYVQPISDPQSIWNINHKLNRYPSVIVFDESGQQGYADIVYLDTNNLQILFADPNSGTAQLS